MSAATLCIAVALAAMVANALASLLDMAVTGLSSCGLIATERGLYLTGRGPQPAFGLASAVVESAAESASASTLALLKMSPLISAPPANRRTCGTARRAASPKSFEYSP